MSSISPPSAVILALYEQHGVVYPDTPTMALHRGRIDLLAQHLARDPLLLGRTFSHQEIYPGEMGCLHPINATVGTPLGGTTLLHMCVEYDEREIALWLLDHGMDVNARSAVGAGGFGGYTALFSPVGSQPHFWMNTAIADRSSHRSPACCWKAAPTRMYGRPYGSNFIPATPGTLTARDTSTAT